MSSRYQDPVIEAYKQAIDRSLIREQLKRSLDERIDRLTEMSRFADQMKREREAKRRR